MHTCVQPSLQPQRPGSLQRRPQHWLQHCLHAGHKGELRPAFVAGRQQLRPWVALLNPTSALCLANSRLCHVCCYDANCRGGEAQAQRATLRLSLDT